MGFYENHILPRIIDSACSTKPILKQREKIVPQAKGRVLEVGMGSAINLPSIIRTMSRWSGDSSPRKG